MNTEYSYNINTRPHCAINLQQSMSCCLKARIWCHIAHHYCSHQNLEGPYVGWKNCKLLQHYCRFGLFENGCYSASSNYKWSVSTYILAPSLQRTYKTRDVKYRLGKIYISEKQVTCLSLQSIHISEIYDSHMLATCTT